MGLLIVMAVILVLAIPVSIVILIAGYGRLRARVDQLQRQVDVLLAERSPEAEGGATAAQPRPPVAAEPEWSEVRPTVEAPEVLADAAVEAEETTPPEPDETPWERAIAARASAPAEITTDGPIVMRADRISALFAWLRDNWVYAISAVSLALAGIFFVQYGIERGLLPPALRVTMAILFGAALIVGGEWIRRRYGDHESASTAYLPSTFSGAGIVSMFAGVLAARQLYGLIGAETAFGGLVAVALVAVVLGWFHGPFLVAVGLIGATAAPFVLGGSNSDPSSLFAYFGLIAFVGLAVDAARRWAWVSVLAMVLTYGAAWLLNDSRGGIEGWFAVLLTALPLMAIALPLARLVPDHDGPMIGEAFATSGKTGWPHFPVRLAGGAMAASAAGLMMLRGTSPTASMLIFACLTVLVLAVTIWAARARSLSDLALLPALAFLARLALEPMFGGYLFRNFMEQASHLRPPETAPPATVTVLLLMAVAGSAAAAWRSFRDDEYKPHWAAAAALLAPVSALILELLWQPAVVAGAYPWALHIIALAAMMAVLAERFARQDGEDRRRTAYMTLSALSLIALALFLVTTKGALTVALSVLIVVAAALDRRFRLPEMGWFIQAGVLVLGWRLIADPGLTWAFDAPVWEVALAFLAAIAAMAMALRLLAPLVRQGAAVFLESGLAAHAAIFANVLILRWIDSRFGGDYPLSHWSLALNAMPWIVLMLVQLYRMQLGGWMMYVRGAIAGVAALVGFLGLGAAAVTANPLYAYGAGGLVRGPLVLDTLLAAYAIPALVLLIAQTRLGRVAFWIRPALTGIGAALAVLYIGLEIRRFWRGDDLSGYWVTQPELYSYTIAMMLAGAALLYQAIARRSAPLRRIAMAVIALTVAKVFLIDASGLSGLMRVFSFLALGLSLAALAWLNRWAAGRQGASGPV
mgnify:CR=1 FL=1